MPRRTLAIAVALISFISAIEAQPQLGTFDGHYWRRLSDRNPVQADALKLYAASQILALMEKSYNTRFDLTAVDLVILFDDFYADERNLSVSMFSAFNILVKERARQRLYR